MEKITLDASKRTVRGKQVRSLREAGQIPAVVYGRDVKSEPLTIDAKIMEKVFRHAGGNRIVALKVGEGRARNVLIHDVQRAAAKGELTHVDFYVVKMDEELRTEVPLHFVGESTAVYQQEGTLSRLMESVEIEALPSALPESIEVDISILTNFDQAITLADLKLPAGVKFVTEHTDALVARVEPPRTDQELADLEGDVGDAVPEGAQETSEVVSESNEGDKDQ
jgi:large subunit ribosomal protein L25